jgi:hypothetical protein
MLLILSCHMAGIKGLWGERGRNHPTHPTLLHRPIKLYDVETKHVLDNSRGPTRDTYLFHIIKYHR